MKITELVIYLFIFVCIKPLSLCAQHKYEKSFYGGLHFITDYMVSNEYQQFSKDKSDLQLVDHLYEKALIFFNNDPSETCFCLTFVFIPFDRILARFPLLNFKMTIPLPAPLRKIFEKKLKITPKRIFFDSSKDDFGDKDKLAHFFSNAFLQYNVNLFKLSEFLGIFVELFEQQFFLQGGYDYRDLVANHLGEFFAKMIKNNSHAKPSEALLVYQLLFFNI